MAGTKMPAFRLPRLTADIDCGPIGYPGLRVHFWLNVTFDPDRVTDDQWARGEAARKQAQEAAGEEYVARKRQPWESDYHYGLGRIVDRVEIPAAYNAASEDLDIPIGTGEALYQLLRTAGFEQDIINWASTQYWNRRQERLQAEIKN